MRVAKVPIIAAVLLIALVGVARSQNYHSSDSASGVSVERVDWYENRSSPSWCLASEGEADKPCSAAYRTHSNYSGSDHSRFPSELTVKKVDRGFSYRMTLRNLGEITIENVEWDYVFIDPVTQAEAGRHRFSSRIKVQPHQTRLVVEQSSSPPTKVISVKALLQPELNGFIEKVVIRRVTYEDGVTSENRPLFPSAVTSGSLYIKPAQ